MRKQGRSDGDEDGGGMTGRVEGYIAKWSGKQSGLRVRLRTTAVSGGRVAVSKRQTGTGRRVVLPKKHSPGVAAAARTRLYQLAGRLKVLRTGLDSLTLGWEEEGENGTAGIMQEETGSGRAVWGRGRHRERGGQGKGSMEAVSLEWQLEFSSSYLLLTMMLDGVGGRTRRAACVAPTGQHPGIRLCSGKCGGEAGEEHL